MYANRFRPFTLWVACLCSSAIAQQGNPFFPGASFKLIDMDSTYVPGPGHFAAFYSERSFSSHDRLSYSGLEADVNLHAGVGFSFRANIANVETYSTGRFSDRYGGSDGEVLSRFVVPEFPNLVVSLGAGVSDSPLRHGGYAIFSAVDSMAFPGVTLFAGPETVVGQVSVLSAIWFGLEIPFDNGFAIVGDQNWVFQGDNTFSLATGRRRQESEWGVALRYRPFERNGQISVEAGLSTAEGGTALSGMTPGIGANPAWFLEVSFHH